MIKGRVARWVAISFSDAARLRVPSKCAQDSSLSDDLVWLDKRRLARQIHRAPPIRMIPRRTGLRYI
jgi:hypothetical protein